MVEFALVSPLFFFVVFAAIESGLMFRTNLVLEDMSRSSARVGAIERDDTNADVEILREIRNADSTLPGRVKYIMIFKADDLNGNLPAGCLDASGDPVTVPNMCSTYDQSYEDVINGSSPTQPGWMPVQREEWDYLGVYVEYDYSFVTGFLGDITLQATSVQVVELDQ